jgi:dolichyl-phosphate-mannose-protein mannosyltransferase
MAQRRAHSPYLQEKNTRRSGKSPARSPGPNERKQQKRKPSDYSSEGVTDYDIFNLPSSDWQLLGVLTVIAAVIRLFRIYQPSSVVFDEVQ